MAVGSGGLFQRVAKKLQNDGVEAEQNFLLGRADQGDEDEEREEEVALDVVRSKQKQSEMYETEDIDEKSLVHGWIEG